MARIEQQLAGLATLSPARLRAEWRTLNRGQKLPPDLSPSQLARSVAWRMQERHFGGLPSAVERELGRLAAQLEAGEDLDLASKGSIKPGSQLVRHWRKNAYVVTVVDEGFEYEGQLYASLTQIARLITGAAWSGPRFFGMRKAKP